MRHDLDFDKYEALRLAEQLAAIVRSSNYAKASFYDLAASSLRERLSVQNGHFKAYFLAVLAEKDYSTVPESLAKFEKSLSRRDNAATRLRRSLPYARPVSNQRPNNIRCFYCGMAGHRVEQCFRKHRDMASSKCPQPDVSRSFANKLR